MPRVHRALPLRQSRATEPASGNPPSCCGHPGQGRHERPNVVMVLDGVQPPSVLNYCPLFCIDSSSLE